MGNQNSASSQDGPSSRPSDHLAVPAAGASLMRHSPSMDMIYKELDKLILSELGPNNESLDLSSKGLSMIPEQIAQFKSLKSLKLSRNLITSAVLSDPSQFALLQSIQSLDLSLNRITDLVTGRWDKLVTLILDVNRFNAKLMMKNGFFPALKTLSLNQCSLSDFQCPADAFRRLTRLSLRSNKLQSISESILCLPALQELDLSENTDLHALPHEFGLMLKLSSLNLSSCGFTSFPHDALCQLRTLQRLDFSNNQIMYLGSARRRRFHKKDASAAAASASARQDAPELDEVEEEIDQLEGEDEDVSLIVFPRSSPLCGSLVDLNLSGNKLKALPSSLNNLITLKRLNISGNKLCTLPKGIGALKEQLQELKASENKIAFLPASFSNLYKLVQVDLDHNSISSFPKEMTAKMVSLTSLHLSHNRITSPNLSFSFESLLALSDLSLSHNQLTQFPSGIFTSSSSLNRVSLSHNQITEFPASSSNVVSKFKCFALETLLLDQNRLTGSVPASLLFDLPALTTLSLSENRLSSIILTPSSCAHSLKTLNLSSNMFEEVTLRQSLLNPSTSRTQWPSLASLDISDCGSWKLSDEEISSSFSHLTIQQSLSKPVLIPGFPNLYFGSDSASSNFLELKKRGVNNILITGSDLEPRAPDLFKYVAMQLENGSEGFDERYTLETILPKAVDFIKRGLSSGGAVLVHDGQCVSRAPMVVAAFLMKESKITRDNAIAALQSVKNDVAPIPIFMNLLAKWEKKCML